jgi:hypothetical protein
VIKKQIFVKSSVSAAPSAASAWALGALGEDLAEEGVVFVFVYVVDANMSNGGKSVSKSCYQCERHADGVRHTVVDYPASDTCVRDPYNTDTHSPATHGQGHV